jgi:outer membrane receptor protein involved in Fe transport
MLLVHVIAQAAAAAAAPEAAAPAQGVISYPQAFFAAQQPTSAADMLGRLPGFSLDTGDNIRGFEGGGGNVLIDGQRPSSKTDNLWDILNRLPASQVERIDLIRGGAPGIDMQGKAVVANVIRKSGGGFRGAVAFANNHVYDGRNMYGLRLELSGGKDRRSWEMSARFGHGNDDGGDYGPELRIAPNGALLRRSQVESEADGGQRALTGAYELPALGGRLKVNGRLFEDKFKFEEDNIHLIPAGLGTEFTDDVYRLTQDEVGGSFKRALGAKTNLELIGLRQGGRRRVTSAFRSPDGTSRFALSRESEEILGRAVVKYQWDPKLSFEAGAETALNTQDSETGLTIDGVAITLPAAAVQVEEARSEVFLRGAWRPSANWSFDAGVRYESSRITSDGDVVLEKTLRFIKPRLAASWQATPTRQLRLSVERTVGQLNFGDFTASSSFNTGSGVSAGNPDLNPEQAWVGEASLEQRFWGAGALVLTARHFELSDTIDQGPVFLGADVFDRPTNIGGGTKDELSANLTLPLDRIRLKGAQLKAEGSWRKSKVTDPTTGVARGISNLRPLQWSVTFNHDLPHWRMSYGANLYGGWSQTSYRFDAIRTVKLHNAYLQPYAEWRLRPDLILRFELGNLTERGIRVINAQYAGPRNTAPLLYTTDRDLAFGRMYYVRLRKTFGA